MTSKDKKSIQFETKTLKPDEPKEELEKIGNYKLLEIIGRGGMGTVYLAKQERPIRRRVALKLIKPGMDSKEIIARFESEQQALALMTHLNIAQVYDSGATEQGYPYFVMEYVAGVPIDEYCDKNELTTQERLKLFIHVCDAVQHAHYRGIVHRDLKPSNILVTYQDKKHIPKIIDFGIAKALTGQGLTEKTLHTVHGVAIGTPVYMSPEQAELTGYDIDTRTDVYSLGVLLYKLLVGVTPFEEKELEKAGLMEILRIIREEESPRPSTRFGILGDASTEIAKKRGISKVAMTKMLKGDLDWIVMKAIEKDKKRRYGSATELSTDIERYLNREPIQARPPSVMYRIKKYVRRHKAASFAAISILILIIMFSIWNMIERRKAEVSLKEANFNYAVSIKEKAKLYAEKNQWQLVKLYALNSLFYQAKAQKYARMNDIKLPFEYQDWILKCTISKDVQLPTFSPDYKYMALIKQDQGVIEIWDVFSRKNKATFKGHIGEVVFICFSHDSQYLASSGRDKIIRIWKVSNGENIATLRGHDRIAQSLDFSPDGRYIASGGWDGKIKIWDINSGKESITLKGHEDRVFSVVFSPIGKHFLSKSLDGITKIWEVTTGREITKLKGRKPSTLFSIPYSPVFSPDGKFVAVGLGERIITILELPSGRPIAALRGHEYQVNSVSFSPNGQLLATASSDRSIKIWEVYNGREIATLRGHEYYVISVSFSPDGRYLVSGSSDLTIKIWDLPEGNEIATIIGSKEPVISVCFSHDGKSIYSESSDELNIWELLNDRVVSTLEGHEHSVIDVSFSSDGRKLASGSSDMTVKTWDVLSRNEIASKKGDEKGVVSINFDPDLKYAISLSKVDNQTINANIWDISDKREMVHLKKLERSRVRMSPDGKFLLAEDKGGNLKVWEIYSGREISTLKGFDSSYLSEFSPDGKYIASGEISSGDTYRSIVKIWEVFSGKEVITLKAQLKLSDHIIFSRDGRYIAAVYFDKKPLSPWQKLMIWEVSSGKEIATLTLKHEPYKGLESYIGFIAFSPDGKYLVSWDYNGIAKIWTFPSGKEIATLGEYDNRAGLLTFSLDGRFLATGMDDRTIKIWEVSTGKEIITLMGHKEVINSLKFSPDGRFLASGSSDKTVKIWDLDFILKYLWLGLDFPYRVNDVQKLIKEAEKQTGFTLDVLTPVPIKRTTLAED